MYLKGARWFSDRVLSLQSKGHWFKTHQRHYIVSLSKTLYPLLNTRSTEEARKLFCHD